jgi:FKBP-type peptidyl-prolyl cis-trans isomerase FkpA
MISNKFHSLILAASLISLLLPLACVKDDEEERKRHEKEVIQKYLSDNGVAEDKKTEGGIYFIEETPGNGASPVEGDYVIINYAGKYLEGLKIRETNYDSLKSQWSAAATYENFLFGPSIIPFGQNVSGINEGLSMMREGGKATLIIPSDKAFYDYNPLLYEIELLKVVRNPVTYADSLLEAYLAENGFDASTLMIKGNDTIWFKEILTPDPSDTVTVETNDEVYFRFAGLLIDEFRDTSNDTFDTNFGLADDPIMLIYGKTKISSGSMITPSTGFPAGLSMALDSMRQGTHAMAVLPYNQAFGYKGLINSTYRYTIIPTYQHVVYDIILDDIVNPAKK